MVIKFVQNHWREVEKEILKQFNTNSPTRFSDSLKLLLPSTEHTFTVEYTTISRADGENFLKLLLICFWN